jgi:stage II sporulation protein D
VVPAGCAGPRRPSTDDAPLIRVRLAAGADEVRLGAAAPVVVQTAGDPTGRKLSFPDGPDAGVPVTLEANQWRIGNVTLPAGELRIAPDAVPGAAPLSVNGSPYRGAFRLVPQGPGRFDVVNDLDIETYLASVLPAELFADWNPETYKAQAVVARTYALYEARSQGQGRHWDVWGDIRSQAYGGARRETAKSTEAVDATRGLVVAYGPSGAEKIFKTYFSACCGGIGQNVTDAFAGEYMPPLGERDVGQLCSIGPRFNWAPITIDKVELTRRIRGWGASRNHPVQRMGMLDRIDVEYVNRLGRPVRFVLTDASGQRYSLGSEETRWACNYDRGQGPQLYSSFFTPVNRVSEIVFGEGRGHGHGVGLCQWCAEALARGGVPAEEIVRFSFPRAVIVKAY